MSYELLVGRKTPSDTLNLTRCTTQAVWTTQRTGQPGKLTFTYLRTPASKIEEGDVVRFSVNGQLQFYGWVFTRGFDRWGPVDVVCYDRLRYLKVNASYSFYAQSAADIIKQIAEDLELDVGELADTGYKLPSLIMQDKSCIDIINTAVQKTLLNTGKVFVFYDSGDGLALKEAKDLKTDIVIGDHSLMTNYTFDSSIDSQTYNSVKIARPNKETGKADVFIMKDSETIGKWGLLQLYQKVDEAANDAQCQEQARVSLEYYDRVLQQLKFSALGVPSLRAGALLLVNLSDLDGEPFKRYVMLEKAEHTFKNDEHTMELEAKAL